MAYKGHILCFIVLILCGCVRDTALDSGVERRLVVEFVLDNDGQQDLYLSVSRRPGEYDAPIIHEAEIRLKDLSTGYEGKFVRADDIHWTMNYSGIPGHKYLLDVNADGYDSICAEQEMPKSDGLEKSGYGNVFPFPGYVSYGNFFYVDCLPDYMMVRGIKKEKESGTISPIEYLCTDYPGLEEINMTEQIYDGDPKWRTETKTGDWSYEYAYHDEPVPGMDGKWTYMFPNLVGKALYKGSIFISKVDDKDVRLDKLYDFKKYSTEDGDTKDAKSFCISGSFHKGFAFWDYKTKEYFDSDHNPIDYEEYLVYSALSEDYGRFLKDVYQFKKTHETDDISTIYLRDNIYSNIQGGLGIFGAMSSNMIEFKAFHWEPKQ